MITLGSGDNFETVWEKIADDLLKSNNQLYYKKYILKKIT